MADVVHVVEVQVVAIYSNNTKRVKSVSNYMYSMVQEWFFSRLPVRRVRLRCYPQFLRGSGGIRGYPIQTFLFRWSVKS